MDFCRDSKEAVPFCLVPVRVLICTTIYWDQDRTRPLNKRPGMDFQLQSTAGDYIANPRLRKSRFWVSSNYSIILTL